MANKKKPKRSKREKLHEIDHIPKCSQQPRTPGGSKRRTDFSLFLCYSSSLSFAPLCQGSLLESPTCKDIPSSVSIASLDETRDKRQEVLKPTLTHCSQSEDKKQELFSNIFEVPVVEVESAAQNAVLRLCSDRNVGEQTSNIVKTNVFTPDKSETTESNDICIAPGSVVWSQTPHQLSYSEDGFEERCCNPMEEFQDALKQALNHDEHLSSYRELIGSSDGPDCSNQQDRSPEKLNSSSSSRTESDCQERGRGKRERKQKVHFDEVNFSLKSARKVRRFRIMRFLGLAAPVGSPF